MKKTILFSVLVFTGGILMAQPQPGGNSAGNQIKIRSIKPPRPEKSENESSQPSGGTQQTIKTPIITAPTDKPTNGQAPGTKGKE